jgi:hypothetical protein
MDAYFLKFTIKIFARGRCSYRNDLDLIKLYEKNGFQIHNSLVFNIILLEKTLYS